MNNNEYSQAYLRKRKMLLVLPLLVLPFITMAFWALGGGKSPDSGTNQTNKKQGLNLQLPDARLKEDKGLNKLSYYEIAASDSAKLKERMRNDPYFKIKNINPTKESDESIEDTSMNDVTNAQRHLAKAGLNNSPYNQHGNIDPNEEKVMKKLNQLNAALDNTMNESSRQNSTGASSNYSTTKSAGNKEQLDRFESIMQQASQQENKAEDPEMKQINGMLDKIMDIQHPDRIRERVQQNSLEHQQQVFPVTPRGNIVTVSLLTNDNDRKSDTAGNGGMEKSNNAFYSIDAYSSTEGESQNVLNAVVHETQTIVSGSTVKLRLLNDAYINGTLITKDNFVFGTASLSGERLVIEIKSIRYNSALFPVALSVYDMDGMDGIYIPGAIARNSAKESSDKAIQSVALNSLDPTLSAQAASAGIEAAKSLLSKKVKLVKVTIKAGYRVLLKDNNTK